MEIYNQVDKVVYKSPGNFDILTTHYTKLGSDLHNHEINNVHVLLPKRQEVKSTGRPRTTGILSQ